MQELQYVLKVLRTKLNISSTLADQGDTPPMNQIFYTSRAF